MGGRSDCDRLVGAEESFPTSSSVVNSKKVSSIECDQVESALFFFVIVNQTDSDSSELDGI